MTSLVDCLRTQGWRPCLLACEWIRVYSDPDQALLDVLSVRASDFGDDGQDEQADGWNWVRWLVLSLAESSAATPKEAERLRAAVKRFDSVVLRAYELLFGEDWDSDPVGRVSEAACRRHLVPTVRATAWWRDLAGEVFSPHIGDIVPEDGCAV